MKRLASLIIPFAVCLSAFAALPTKGETEGVLFSSPNKQLRVELSQQDGLHFTLIDGFNQLIERADIGMIIQSGSTSVDVSKAF